MLTKIALRKICIALKLHCAQFALCKICIAHNLHCAQFALRTICIAHNLHCAQFALRTICIAHNLHCAKFALRTMCIAQNLPASISGELQNFSKRKKSATTNKICAQKNCTTQIALPKIILRKNYIAQICNKKINKK